MSLFIINLSLCFFEKNFILSYIVKEDAHRNEVNEKKSLL